MQAARTVIVSISVINYLLAIFAFMGISSATRRSPSVVGGCQTYQGGMKISNNYRPIVKKWSMHIV